MSFDYEKSIWGRGRATLSISDPRSIRLREALFAIRGLKAGDKVLELGCGAGQFIRAIKELRPELDCYGSDISATAIKTASETNDGVKYVLQGETDLPFGPDSFSAVVLFDVLEHVSDPSGVLSEIFNKLKPNGILYAFVPCEGDALSLWRLLRSIGIGRGLTEKHAGHIQAFTRKDLLEKFEKVGFEKQRMRYCEHIIGQIVGVFAFFVMDRSRSDGQINNEEFFSGKNGFFVRSIKNIVNSLIFFESYLLQILPSPNVHITVKKR